MLNDMAAQGDIQYLQTHWIEHINVLSAVFILIASDIILTPYPWLTSPSPVCREADLVTAHEFGHNWGSEHDPDMPECSPSASKGGSYLMYTYSVSGYDLNNKVREPLSTRALRGMKGVRDQS